MTVNTDWMADRTDRLSVGQVPSCPHVQRVCQPEGRLGTAALEHRDCPPTSLCSRRFWAGFHR
jgi:hypothetical protein